MRRVVLAFATIAVTMLILLLMRVAARRRRQRDLHPMMDDGNLRDS